MPDCEKGKEFTVLRIDAGFKAKKRLADLGILPDTKIMIKITAPFHGPVEIFVRDSSIVK